MLSPQDVLEFPKKKSADGASSVLLHQERERGARETEGERDHVSIRWGLLEWIREER